MNTVDKAVQVPKKQGRPKGSKNKLSDKISLQGEYRQLEAEKFRSKVKSKDTIVEKWYEIVAGTKLCLCKRTEKGSVYRTFTMTLSTA